MPEYDKLVSKPTHKLWYKSLLRFGRLGILPAMNKFYRVSAERYRDRQGGPYILLFNHICDYDFLGTLEGYRYYTRYVISEALIRKTSRRIFMNLVSDFIYRRKGDNADTVVESIKLTLNEGIDVCMAPEGEESPNGETAPIRRRTGTVIKETGAGLITFRLEGGYFLKPTWAVNRAKGPMFGKVIGVYSPEELSDKSPDEINDIIAKDLHINHYDWQREKMIPYDRKGRAEHMERVLHTCPVCENIESLKSEGDELFCKECGYKVTVDEYGFFRGDSVKFDNLRDWDIWQKNLLKQRLDGWSNPEVPIVVRENTYLQTVENSHPVILDDNVTMKIFIDRVEVSGTKQNLNMPMKEIKGVALSYDDTVAINYNGTYYQIRSRVPSSCFLCRSIYRIIKGDPRM